VRNVALLSFRLLATGLVLIVLAGTQARSFALFRCQFTGTASASCCCPSVEAKLTETHAALSKACCCQIEKVDAKLPPSSSISTQLAQLSPGPALLLVAPAPAKFVSLVPLQPNERMIRCSRRTRAGPPLTIVYRRLLI
jgi:hypothetical protein